MEGDVKNYTSRPWKAITNLGTYLDGLKVLSGLRKLPVFVNSAVATSAICNMS